MQNMRMTKLRLIRQELGLTLQQVAQQVATNIGNLSRLECGKQNPSKALAERLFRFYKGRISIAEIFNIDDRRERKHSTPASHQDMA